MHTHEKRISLMLRERPLPGKGKHTYKGFSSFSLFTEETIKKNHRTEFKTLFRSGSRNLEISNITCESSLAILSLYIAILVLFFFNSLFSPYPIFNSACNVLRFVWIPIITLK